MIDLAVMVMIAVYRARVPNDCTLIMEEERK